MVRQTKRQKGQPRIGTCAYCGTHGVVTRDHVVPSCLTPKGATPLAIVDACRPCNAAKSSFEVDFRDYLSLCIQSEGHPDRDRLMRAAARSTQRNSSPLGRAVTWQSRRLAIVLNGAIQDFVLAPNDPDPILKCLDFVVKGLHHHSTGSSLPYSSSVDVTFLDAFGPTAFTLMFNAMQIPPTKILIASPGILTAYVWYFPEIQDTTCWALEFLEGVQFLAYAGPPEMSPTQFMNNDSEQPD